VGVDMGEKRCGNILLVILVLLVLFSGCEETGDDTIYCNGSPEESYMDVVSQSLPQYRVVFNEEDLLFLLRSGKACEADHIVAKSAMDKGLAKHWYPHYLSTVVIAVDRDKTDEVVSGWEDLRNAKGTIGYLARDSRPSNDQMLFAAISHGLDHGNYLSSHGLSFMKELYRSGRIAPDDKNAPLLICYDNHAVALMRQGKNLEIIIPKEGTLSYEIGLLSKDSLEFSPGMDERLLDAGYRLMDGRHEGSLYPEEEKYASAMQISDYDTFNEQSMGYTVSFRRGVMGTHRFRSADGKEHALVAILTMVVIIVFFGFIQRRILDSYIKRIFFFSGFILLGWAFLRYIKYESYTNMTVERYLWYGYYIFLLAIPISMLWLSIAIDDPGRSMAKKRAEKVLPVLYGFMLLCVLTNDLHNRVFVLDKDSPTCNVDYGYGWLYFIIIGMTLMIILASIGILVRKAWKSAGWRGMIFPVIFYLFIFTYIATFVSGVPLARDTDISLTTVFFVLLFYVAAMLTGLIPLNTKYRELFALSPLKMQIVDQSGAVMLHCAAWIPLREGAWERMGGASEPLLLEDRKTLLYKGAIPGGFILWEENIKELQLLYAQTQEIIQRIATTNQLLLKEKEVKSTGVRSEQKEKLMSMLEREVSEKTEELNELVQALPGKEDKKSQVGKITMLLCHIKRRINLLFLENETEEIPSEDLVFYLEELSEFAEHGGISLMVFSHGEEMLPTRQVTLFYDFFHSFLQACADREATSILIQLIFDERGNRMTMLTSMGDMKGAFKKSPLWEAIRNAGGKISIKKLDDSTGIEVVFFRGGEER
jgi:hypothetical protein